MPWLKSLLYAKNCMREWNYHYGALTFCYDKAFNAMYSSFEKEIGNICSIHSLNNYQYILQE